MAYQARLASLRTRATVAQTLIVLFMVVAALVAVFTALVAWREFNTKNSTFMVMHPALVLFLLLAFLPASVAICAWIWRAHANLRDDRREGLNYSPAWAVASLLIPLVNLAVPMQIMRELWNRSHGEEQWGARQTVSAVSSWWTCFVCGAVIHTLLFTMVMIDLTTPFNFLTPPGVNPFFVFFASALLAGSGWYLFRIIGAVTRAQHSVTHVGDTFA
jgi:Domain of unknown function (DUF4328)